MQKILFTFMLAFLLSGCQNIIMQLNAVQSQMWHNQKKERDDLHFWNIKLRISLFNRAENQSFIINADWNKQLTFEEITVSDTLGIQRLTFSFNNNIATVYRNLGDIIATERNLTDLMEVVTGHRIPLKRIAKALFGVYENDDEYLVEYLGYTLVNNHLLLPSYIMITSDDYVIKIKVKDWKY